MSEQYLAVYLNDHLAGSAVAIELLEHLEKTCAGTSQARCASTLRADISADRQELEGLMTRLRVPISRAREAAAWLAQKVTALKLQLDDSACGTLRLLEVFEAVSIGIEGKRLLWRALATVAEDVPSLRGIDYAGLIERAENRRQQVETVRLEAARTALATSSAGTTL